MIFNEVYIFRIEVIEDNLGHMYEKSVIWHLILQQNHIEWETWFQYAINHPKMCTPKGLLWKFGLMPKWWEIQCESKL